MQNKIIYVLFGIIIIMLASNSFQSCNRDEREEAEYKKQTARYEKLSESVKEIAARRVDSIKVIERRLTEKIIEKEKVQNEVYNLTDLDSVVKRYYYWRPEQADSTIR